MDDIPLHGKALDLPGLNQANNLGVRDIISSAGKQAQKPGKQKNQNCYIQYGGN